MHPINQISKLRHCSFLITFIYSDSFSAGSSADASVSGFGSSFGAYIFEYASFIACASLDLIHGKTTTTPVVEEPPVVEEVPVVDTAPASVEEPVDPEPIDLWSLSKDELEDYGRTIGIELDRRLSKNKLVKQLEDHIDYLKTV